MTTGVICPTPILQFFDNNGNLLVGGSVVPTVGGILTPVYQDVGLTIPLPFTGVNGGFPLNSRGEPSNASGSSQQLFLTPNVVYTFTLFDANGNQLNQALYVNGVQLVITQASIGALLYPTIGPETSAGITPVNFQYPPGYVDRYLTNLVPGITDMSAAFQIAINVAQAVIGGGENGLPVRFLAAAYSIVTPPTIATSTPNIMVPLDISGAGLGTVLYCGATGTGGLLSLTSGCYLHDMQIVSAAGTTNTGVIVETTGGVQPVGWRIERVYSRMQGIGFLLSSTNTGVIRDCWHWADNAPALPTAIDAGGVNVSHGIYATGSFVHDVSIYDFRGGVSVNYASGQRWIKNDCTNSFNFRIRGGLPVNESPSTSQQLLELGNNAGGSHIDGAECVGVYHESGFLQFNNVAFSNIYSCTNTVADAGGVGLKFTSSSIANVIGANSENGTMTFDASSGGNVIMGGNYTGFTDSATLPNQYVTANRSASYGGIIDNTLTYSTSMTPNMFSGTYVRIVANNTTAFTINAPTNPSLGQTMVLVIFNTNASSALGTITWNAIYKMSAWTSPAATYNRSISFTYDGTYWIQTSQTGVDVTN